MAKIAKLGARFEKFTQDREIMVGLAPRGQANKLGVTWLIRKSATAVRPLPRWSGNGVWQRHRSNLMLNGIEAMQDETGELSVTSKRTEDGQLLISVSDSGIGLPGEEPERIFAAFFTTKPHGTGMGLSISRRIIESHGGRLWSSPNTGRGATFQFTVPRRVMDSPEAV